VSNTEAHKSANDRRWARVCALALCLLWPLSAAQAQPCDPHELSAGEPFWQSDLMANETVMMLAPTRGGVAQAQLLWPATEILSVRDSTLGIVLQPGVDFSYEAGSLRLSPSMSHYALPVADLAVEGQPRWEENHWYHTHQLVVTYLHEPGLWRGPLPAFRLERLRAKLSAPGAQIRLSILGDSIALGYSASGFSTELFQAEAPFLMTWPQVVTCRLQQRYGVNVQLSNASAAGKTSAWGRQVVRSLVSVTSPDLVVIAFGMNDGSEGVAANSFAANIQAIIDDVRALNPAADFIIVAPMLAHPAWAMAGNQAQYLPWLTDVADRNDAALVDMTTTHSQLLTVKRYADTTGNGVNHPNDFLSRWYGYLVSAAIDGSQR